MSWTDFFAKLMEKPFLFLLLTGAALVLIAASGGIALLHLSIASPGWQWIIGIMGITCFGCAVFSFIRGPGRHPSTKHLQKKYDIKITSHRKGQSLTSPISLWGTYRRKPPERYLFAVEYNPETRLYWVRDKLSFDISEQSWQTTMNIGPGDNKERILIIAYAGEDTLKMIQYYKGITSQDIWIGIEEMPADFHRLAEVQIVLRYQV